MKKTRGNEVDWESLAKHLQAALKKEISDSERLAKELEEATDNMLMLKGIIVYLEMQLERSNPV